MQTNIITKLRGVARNHIGSSVVLPAQEVFFLGSRIVSDPPASLPLLPSTRCFRHGRDRQRQQLRAADAAGVDRVIVVDRPAYYILLVDYNATSPDGPCFCKPTSSHCVQLGSPPGFYANLAAGAGQDTCTFSSRTTCAERAGSGPVFLTTRPAIASGNSLGAIIPSGSYIA